MAWQGTADLLRQQLQELKEQGGGRPRGWLREAVEYDTYAALCHLHEVLNNAVQPALNASLDTWDQLELPHPKRPDPGQVGPEGVVGPHPFPPHSGNYTYPSPGLADTAWQLAAELDNLRTQNNWNGAAWLTLNLPLDQRFAQDVLTFIRDAADCN